MIDTEKLQHMAVKIRELMAATSAKATSAIEQNAAMVTANTHAAHDDIEQAITKSREAKDTILKRKSEAMIAIDNIARNIPQGKF